MSILDSFRLDGQVAVVTGSGRGIGAGTAIAYADAGADVVVSARTVAQLEETAEQIRARGQRALVVPCDVLEAEQRVGIGLLGDQGGVGKPGVRRAGSAERLGSTHLDTRKASGRLRIQEVCHLLRVSSEAQRDFEQPFFNSEEFSRVRSLGSLQRFLRLSFLIAIQKI